MEFLKNKKKNSDQSENEPSIVLKMQVKINGQFIPNASISQSRHHATNCPRSDTGNNQIPECSLDAGIRIGFFELLRNIFKNKPGHKIGGNQEQARKYNGEQGITRKRKCKKHPDQGDESKPKNIEVAFLFFRIQKIHFINDAQQRQINPTQ